MRPRQNGRHFPDNIFKCIFLNANLWISINISLNFVPKGQIDNTLALVQIMAWHRPGDKPLSEPMTVSFLIHIGISRPQWVNASLSFIISHCTLTHYPLRLLFQMCKFQTQPGDRYHEYPSKQCPTIKASESHWWLVNIGSGNGLVPSGNKPLPEPMLTPIYVAIWHH